MKMRLKAGGIDNPDLEARFICKHFLNINDADLISGAELAISDEKKEQLQTCITRRLAGEPLSRIFGEREFWGLTFKVTPDVLDPRPDTETLIEAALKRFSLQPPQKILDLGTGSGCILIALLKAWPQARGTGVDISQAALAVAQGNAEHNGVADRARFLCSDWGAALNDSYDLIVANPPYIPSRDIPNLQVEVKDYDPILALDGGATGLKAYKCIFTEIKRLLHPQGRAFFEIGISQEKDIARLAAEADLSVTESYRDIAGILRVMEIGLGKT